MRGRPLALDDPASGDAAVLLAKLRQENASRRTWLLDITTDLGIPAIAAVSCRADGKGFACGLGARPTVTGAARGAIMELCQSELAHAVVAVKEAESGAERLNDRDRAHIARATRIDAGACALLHPLGVPARREVCAAEDAVSTKSAGSQPDLPRPHIETFVIDLTRPRFAVPVVRVVAPGLQIEPSKLGEPSPATGDRGDRGRAPAHRWLAAVLDLATDTGSRQALDCQGVARLSLNRSCMPNKNADIEACAILGALALVVLF